MQAARSQNRWSRRFRPTMLVLSVLAIAAMATGNDVMAAAGLAFAVIVLGLKAIQPKPTKATADDLTEAVWPADSKPRFSLADRAHRAQQKSVGVRLDEIERLYRRGKISKEERLARRDRVITTSD